MLQASEVPEAEMELARRFVARAEMGGGKVDGRQLERDEAIRLLAWYGLVRVEIEARHAAKRQAQQAGGAAKGQQS